MIVKYIGKRTPGLTKGQSYKVIAVNFYPSKNDKYEGSYRLFRDEDDENTAIFPIADFDVIDSSIDEDYIFFKDDSGGLVLCPECIAYPSFWTDYWGDGGVSIEDEAKAIKLLKERFPEFFPSPNYRLSEEPAIILDPKISWLFCPACTESWEVKTDDELTACPSCGLYYHNPFIKSAGEES